MVPSFLKGALIYKTHQALGGGRGKRGEGVARGTEPLPDRLPLNEKNISVRVR